MAEDEVLAVVAASPGKESSRREVPSTPDPKTVKRGPDLVNIHKKAISELIRKRRFHPESKAEQLRLLRQKRIHLASQIAELRLQRGRTVGDELRSRREDRPYVKRRRPESSENPVQQVLKEQDLAVRMQEIRRLRKIAAAYRLAGITLWPCPDKDVLALRLDVAVEGTFVACYHCFFDLCCNPAAELYLRLVQHTLPPSVPLGSILETTLGGVAVVGPLQETSAWKTKELMERLRKCASELYQACYCFCARKQAVAFLREKSSQVLELDCTDTLGKISFQLATAGVSSLQVTLGYKDPLRVQPTNVSVKNLVAASTTRKNPHAYLVGEISDDDDGDGHTDDLVENAIVSFRRLPIRKAVGEVLEAMAEW